MLFISCIRRRSSLFFPPALRFTREIPFGNVNDLDITDLNYVASICDIKFAIGSRAVLPEVVKMFDKRRKGLYHARYDNYSSLLQRSDVYQPSSLPTSYLR